jgi:hypothetical protein
MLKEREKDKSLSRGTFVSRSIMVMRVILVSAVCLFFISYLAGMFSKNVPEDFSWLSYADINNKLRNSNYQKMVEFYHRNKGQLPYKEISPAPEVQASVKTKIKSHVELCGTSDPKILDSYNLVVYHVAKYDPVVSSIVLLNLQIFLSSIEPDSCSQKHRTFYLFNLPDSSETKLARLIPTHLPNFAAQPWVSPNSEGETTYTSFRTLELLGPGVLDQFGAVFLLSNHVRGPLGQRDLQGWVGTYRHLLDHNNVGLVLPNIVCSEAKPGDEDRKLHTFAIALRTALARRLVAEFGRIKMTPSSASAKFYPELELLLAAGPAGSADKLGYRSASIAHYAASGTVVYDNECSRKVGGASAAGVRGGSAGGGRSSSSSSGGSSAVYAIASSSSRSSSSSSGSFFSSGSSSSSSSSSSEGSVVRHRAMLDRAPKAADYSYFSHCSVGLKDKLFVRWAPDNVRENEYTCDMRLTLMREYLMEFKAETRIASAALSSVLGTDAFIREIDPFETLYVDIIRTLFLQYTEEERREYASKQIPAPAVPNTQENVCFLVRTSAIHDSVVPAPGTTAFKEYDINAFLTSKFFFFFACVGVSMFVYLVY